MAIGTVQAGRAGYRPAAPIHSSGTPAHDGEAVQKCQRAAIRSATALGTVVSKSCSTTWSGVTVMTAICS